MTCYFCGVEIGHDSTGPDVMDSDAWHAIQAEHAKDCRWAWSRGFKAPTMPDLSKDRSE